MFVLHTKKPLFYFILGAWICTSPCRVSPGQDVSASVADAASSGQAGIKLMNALLKTIESTVLSAEASGRIERLGVTEGTRVKENQIIGQIHADTVRLKYENAKIALEIARKKANSDVNLRLAERRSDVADNELERAEASNRRLPDTYSIKEIERLSLVAATARLEIERAKEDMQLAELDVMLAENEFRQAAETLSLYRVESPVDGTIVSIERRVGEWVEPGTELVKIVNNDRLRIEGFVSTEAAAQDLVGRIANVTVLSGDREWEVKGKVIFVSPDANPVNGNVRVFLELDNRQGRLRPGMRVDATIESPRL